MDPDPEDEEVVGAELGRALLFELDAEGAGAALFKDVRGEGNMGGLSNSVGVEGDGAESVEDTEEEA